jgi:alpha-beta hydrolase superfamily lysophospholipase
MMRRACTLAVCTFVASTVAGPSYGGERAGGVTVRVLAFVDRTRTVELPDGTREPRRIETVVRYPTRGGPDPLVVFGHGFALTPARYDNLLRAWAAAGYVVAAPVFPRENANAPGGPDESDLVNQPGDMRLVITRLLALNGKAGGALAGRIDPAQIAVAGHSDGAETALAAAYDSRFRDARIRAAIIMSGTALPGMGPFPRRGPALLAIQGTADPINSPPNTEAFYRRAPAPKFLLWLEGASHLPPYTTERPQLGIVERVTIAFLDHYLKHGALRRIGEAARSGGRARLLTDP